MSRLALSAICAAGLLAVSGCAGSDETAGAVFLDAAAPEDVVLMSQRKGALQRAVERAANAVAPIDEFAETAHTAETAAQIGSAAPFPDIPLAVITGAKPALAWLTPREVLAARMSHQKKLAALSPRGLQILAPESGHFPQLSEPQVVIDAVRSVVWSIPGLRGRERDRMREENPTTKNT